MQMYHAATATIQIGDESAQFLVKECHIQIIGINLERDSVIGLRQETLDRREFILPIVYTGIEFW